MYSAYEPVLGLLIFSIMEHLAPLNIRGAAFQIWGIISTFFPTPLILGYHANIGPSFQQFFPMFYCPYYSVLLPPLGLPSFPFLQTSLYCPCAFGTSPEWAVPPIFSPSALTNLSTSSSPLIWHTMGCWVLNAHSWVARILSGESQKHAHYSPNRSSPRVGFTGEPPNENWGLGSIKWGCVVRKLVNGEAAYV